MKKYFIVSDIHSFFLEFRSSLFRAGFRKKNKNHILIVLGDIFDRGPGSRDVYDYIRSIPKERRILIRGNHELLLRDAIKSRVFYDTDYRNGTLGTIMQFTGCEYADCVYDPGFVCDEFKKNEILDWIFGPEWQNYAEIGNYIFVHSWIPVSIGDGSKYYDLDPNSRLQYRSDWREASQQDWEKAMWYNPVILASKGLKPQGSTVVCGHWHTSDFRVILDHDYTNYSKNYDIYRGHGCIALDATTVRSGFVNVLVLTEEELHEPIRE